MHDAAVIVSGFDRPNIQLRVHRVEGWKAKCEAIVGHVVGLARPGIVYAATRRETEEIAMTLREHDVNAIAYAYHAGLASDERRAIQDAFMAAEHDVIVATIAFGMGIDKPDLRFVLHAGIGESLDASYQEIGRAGRDGEPAVAILLYDPKDLDLRRFQTGAGELPEEEAVDVLRALLRHRGPSDPARIRDAVELADSRMMRVVNRLEEVGAVEVEPDGTIAPLHQRRDIRPDAEAAVQAHGQHQQFARSRLEMMRCDDDQAYCRRADLIIYFGEAFDPPCGNCANCLAGHGVAESASDQPFAIDMTVHHRQWGDGTVLRYEGNTVVVLFGYVGYRTLLVELAEDGLLTTG